MTYEVGDSHNLCDDSVGEGKGAFQFQAELKQDLEAFSLYVMCSSLMVRAPFCVKVLQCAYACCLLVSVF